MLRTFALIACAASPLAAQYLQFSQPIDCTLGADCFIEDYVDTNPFEKKSQDHRCGLNTRDGHTGTDFALIDFASVEQGVDVLAAAPGRVFRLRDSMPDDRLLRDVTSQNACGNAVILAHADRYQTTYCHLKRGSINVSIGDSVERGQPIGKVGLSGRTSHPHVHFGVKKTVRNSTRSDLKRTINARRNQARLSGLTRQSITPRFCALPAFPTQCQSLKTPFQVLHG